LWSTATSRGRKNTEGNDAPLCSFWIAIVHSADSPFLLDDLDTALQGGSSEKRVAMLRQITDRLLSEADGLNEVQIRVFDSVLVQLIERIEARTLVEISRWLAPVAGALIGLTLNRARYSGARFSENSLAALLTGREVSARMPNAGI
jgi:hypothetical protein